MIHLKASKATQSIVLFLFLVSSLHSFAQTIGYVQINGKVRKLNKPESGVTIQISGPGISPQSFTSKDNGSFTFNLNLQKDYTIVFSKAGLVTKVVNFNTQLPPDQSDIIFQKDFNMDLFDDVAGMSQTTAMTKPVAKFNYNPTYEDFAYDESYSKQIANEQDAARKAAEEVNRRNDRARLDSLNKVWTDSLAKVKGRESELMAQRAEQDRINKEREKARLDSISRANSMAAASAAQSAREKSVQDSLATARVKEEARIFALEKARKDSVDRAEADKAKRDAQAMAAEKAHRDSTIRAQSEKSRLDSMASIKAAAEAKLQADIEAKAKTKASEDSTRAALLAGKAREKARQDSIQSAEFAERNRLKAAADSANQAQALAKIKAQQDQAARIKATQDSLANAKAEALRMIKEADEEKRLSALKEQAKKDSLSAVQQTEREQQKAAAESASRAQAEAKAKADRDAASRLKANQDSVATAKAEALKATKDAEEARLTAIARDKIRRDSTSAATFAEQARQKASADSASKASAEARAQALQAAKEREKSKQDSLVQARADALKKQQDDAEAKRIAAVSLKAHQDSAAAVARAQAAKEDEDRKAKALAEIETKKALMAKANAVEPKKVQERTPPSTAVPKIVDSDYKEGVTEETVTESNRTIFRTVIKKDGQTNNYQKIVYGWGGVFYFKGENRITQSTFEQEVKAGKVN